MSDDTKLSTRSAREPSLLERRAQHEAGWAIEAAINIVDGGRS